MWKLLSRVVDWLVTKLARPEEFAIGRDRIVAVYAKHVVKYPVMNNWFEFVRGVYSNLKEIDNVRNYAGYYEESIPELMSVWFFGLVIVQRRYIEVKDVPLERMRLHTKLNEMWKYESPAYQYIWEQDIKPSNFGWDKHGQLVKFDLGAAY